MKKTQQQNESQQVRVALSYGLNRLQWIPALSELQPVPLYNLALQQVMGTCRKCHFIIFCQELVEKLSTALRVFAAMLNRLAKFVGPDSASPFLALYTSVIHELLEMALKRV